LLAIVAAVLAAIVGAATATGVTQAPGPCRQPPVATGYTTRIDRALRAGQDIWGDELIAARRGPTYDSVRRYLKPLLLARAADGRRLTDSGVHYLPFSQPTGVQGAESVALHVADGSQILSQRADGRSLTVGVGSNGRERYGSCLTRLAPPRLSAGYLPILETQYVDSAGVRYSQESFVARIPPTGSLVSLIRLTADGRRSAAGHTRLRFASSNGSSLGYGVPRGSVRTVYVVFPHRPRPSRPRPLVRASYEEARRSVLEYWRQRLPEGAAIDVPERRVLDAERSLLVQNLGLTWRYSIGNAYEEFSFPEGVDVAEVMSAWGFQDVARAILNTSLGRRPTPYPNWKMGQKLVGSALYYRLFRDRSYVDRVTPVLQGYVEALASQITASRSGLLQRERYSSDIADSVYGLHSQAVAWQGLRWMGQVWEQTGRRSLAARCRGLAAKLERGLRAAVRRSERELPDGSLFIPVRLLDPEQPYDRLTSARAGSYWNLVMPYALASGLFAPGSPQADGVFRYMLRHGSRLLGLVRAGAYALYGRDAPYPTSGTDQVYGMNVARFLADNDQPDQLVLSLYGHLAAAMTPGTFVSGEGASITPLAGEYYRSMYLPPNGASNAAFLETLRLMLVHETHGRDGAPRGLELAYATPRAWLEPGKRIAVRRLPTSFGPISFSISSSRGSASVSLDVPGRAPLRTLSLRLRLPRGQHLTSVTLHGRPYRRFDPASGTIDLPPRAGPLDLAVGFEKH
jgi:hypothetical protein